MDNTNDLYNEFINLLDQLDRPACILWADDILKRQELPIVDLYSNILVPSLDRIASNQVKQAIPIWEEHVKSGIVRSIIEMASPYVLRHAAGHDIKASLPKAVIVCLEEEYHELGARIAADYLTLLDFSVYYVGANTPQHEINAALQSIQPKLLVISVTNYYHLTKLQHFMEDFKLNSHESLCIAVGGYAIDHTLEVHNYIQPDYFVQNFNDFVKIKAAIL